MKNGLEIFLIYSNPITWCIMVIFWSIYPVFRLFDRILSPIIGILSACSFCDKSGYSAWQKYLLNAEDFNNKKKNLWSKIVLQYIQHRFSKWIKRLKNEKA